MACLPPVFGCLSRSTEKEDRRFKERSVKRGNDEEGCLEDDKERGKEQKRPDNTKAFEEKSHTRLLQHAPSLIKSLRLSPLTS
jgi:hypothetical protein